MPICPIIRKMRLLLLFFLTLTATRAAEPPQECPFADGKFTDVDPEAFGLQIARGAGMHEFEMRLFRMLPDDKKKAVLEKVFASEAEYIRARPVAVPFDPKFQVSGYAKLMMRDAFARKIVPELYKKLVKSPEMEGYLSAEIAYAEKHPRKSLTLAEIEALTKKQKTVTAWLKDLPKDFRGRFTAIHDSGALQAGTVQNSRILYFDDELVVGANGDPRQSQYAVAEVMSLDPVRARTQLRTVSETTDGPVKLSDPNPGRCKKCHGQDDPYGQFSAYSFWDGAVGSFRDTIPDGSPEKTALDNLRRQHAEKHERYGLLEKFEEYAAIDPTSGQLAQTPNEKLNEVLNLHAMSRMFRLIVQSPNYCAFRYAIYAALSGCAKIEDFIPEPFRKSMTAHATFVESTAKLKQKLADRFKEVHPKLAADPTNTFLPQNFFDSGKIADLRFLFEGRNLSMKGWSTDTITGYGWTDGVHDLAFLNGLLAFGDRGLTDFFRVTIPDEAACVALKKKSLEALAGMAPVVPPPPTAKPGPGSAH